VQNAAHRKAKSTDWPRRERDVRRIRSRRVRSGCTGAYRIVIRCGQSPAGAGRELQPGTAVANLESDARLMGSERMRNSRVRESIV
jgi:hypothetical protein